MVALGLLSDASWGFLLSRERNLLSFWNRLSFFCCLCPDFLRTAGKSLHYNNTQARGQTAWRKIRMNERIFVQPRLSGKTVQCAHEKTHV